MTHENSRLKLNEIAQALKRLSALESHQNVGLQELEVEAQRIANVAKSSEMRDVIDDMPSFFWLYLSDVDTRKKLVWYKEKQDRTLRKFVAALEVGTILGDKDL